MAGECWHARAPAIVNTDIQQKKGGSQLLAIPETMWIRVRSSAFLNRRDW